MNDDSITSGGAGHVMRSGARWGLLATVLLQLSTIVSTVVPARILTPADFAIVGVATVVIGLFAIVGEAGYGFAVIVGERGDDRRASTSFWMATLVGVCLAIAAAVTSPITARLAGYPDVAPYIAVAALGIPLGLAISVLIAVQLRRFRYGVAAGSQIGLAITTAVVPVILALAGAGAWSLILSQIGGATVQLLILLLLGRFVPSAHFDRSLIREDRGFNRTVLATGVTSYGAKNLDYWVLGNTVSEAKFGAYYVAYVVPNLLRQRATGMLNQVILPVLSRLTTRREQGSVFLDALGMVALLTFPALIGVAILAEPLVALAFGDQWGAAVTPLRILSIAAAIDVTSHSSNALFLAIRRADRMLQLQILRLVSLAIALSALAIWPEPATAAYAVLASVVVGLIGVVVVMRLEQLAGPWELWRAVMPAIAPTVLMTAALFATSSWWSERSPFVSLIIAVPIGVLTYVASGLAVYRGAFTTLLRRAWSMAWPSTRRRAVGRDT